jgi:serine/threonine protein kinase
LAFVQSNIFIDGEWHARLADFGLAGFADATIVTHGTSSNAGSIRWMAPELHNSELLDLKQLRRTDTSDIYAFACVGLEVGDGLAFNRHTATIADMLLGPDLHRERTIL